MRRKHQQLQHRLGEFGVWNMISCIYHSRIRMVMLCVMVIGHWRIAHHQGEREKEKRKSTIYSINKKLYSRRSIESGNKNDGWVWVCEAHRVNKKFTHCVDDLFVGCGVSLAHSWHIDETHTDCIALRFIVGEYFTVDLPSLYFSIDRDSQTHSSRFLISFQSLHLDLSYLQRCDIPIWMTGFEANKE